MMTIPITSIGPLVNTGRKINSGISPNDKEPNWKSIHPAAVYPSARLRISISPLISNAGHSKKSAIQVARVTSSDETASAYEE